MNINSIIVLGIGAAHGLWLMANWVKKQELTPDRILYRLDRLEKDQAATHAKANDTNKTIMQFYDRVDETHVPRGTFDQFLYRFNELERRFNATHNGSHQR